MDSDYQGSYSLLPVQKALLDEESSQGRLSYLPPVPKLAITIHKKRLFIKSSLDKLKHLRMLIFGVLMRAYTDKAQSQLLNKFKKAVYGGQNEQKSAPIDGRLVKKINEVPFDCGSQTEERVVELFTDVFDEGILHPFTELIERQQVDFSKLHQTKDWVQGYFGVDISILNFNQSVPGNICFYFDGENLLMESYKDIDNIQGISIGSNGLTPSQSVYNTQSKNNIMHQNNDDIVDLSLTKVLIQSSCSSPDSAYRIKILRPAHQGAIASEFQERKTKPQGFNLWDYLCC